MKRPASGSSQPMPDLAGNPRAEAALSQAPVAETPFERALLLATRLHGDDVRKGTAIPYVAHLLSVAALVIEQGGSEDQVVASLLHDAAEDHGGVPTLDVIEGQFGRAVRDIVEACSDSLRAAHECKEEWLPRKLRYLEHLRHAERQVLMVSLADKVHNARAILADVRATGDAVFSRFSSPAPQRDNTLEYYVVLADIFEDRLGTPLAAELAMIVNALCVAAGYEPRHRLPAA